MLRTRAEVRLRIAVGLVALALQGWGTVTSAADGEQVIAEWLNTNGLRPWHFEYRGEEEIKVMGRSPEGVRAAAEGPGVYRARVADVPIGGRGLWLENVGSNTYGVIRFAVSNRAAIALKEGRAALSWEYWTAGGRGAPGFAVALESKSKGRCVFRAETADAYGQTWFTNACYVRPPRSESNWRSFGLEIAPEGGAAAGNEIKMWLYWHPDSTNDAFAIRHVRLVRLR